MPVEPTGSSVAASRVTTRRWSMPAPAGEDRHREQDAEDGQATSADQGPAGAELLTDPADERRTERGAAHEDHQVERHHPAAQTGRGRQLHGGVRSRDHRQRGEPEERHDRHVGGVRRHQSREDLDRTEQQRGAGDQPEPDARTPSRHQRAGQRADGHRGAEQAVLGRALVEDVGRHQRRGHLEVQAEGAGEEDDAEDHHQVGTSAQVADALADHPLVPLGPRGRRRGRPRPSRAGPRAPPRS